MDFFADIFPGQLTPSPKKYECFAVPLPLQVASFSSAPHKYRVKMRCCPIGSRAGGVADIQF